MRQKLCSNSTDISFASKLWQVFRAVITGALDELRAVLGNAVALVMETIDAHIQCCVCKSCNLIPGHYGLRLRKSKACGCYMGKNELRNFSIKGISKNCFFHHIVESKSLKFISTNFLKLN